MNPATLSPNSLGAAVSTTLTVSAAPTATALVRIQSKGRFAALLPLSLLAFIRRRTGLRTGLRTGRHIGRRTAFRAGLGAGLLLALAAMLGGTAGCGAPANATGAGSYTVTVTATSGSLTSTTTVLVYVTGYPAGV